MKIIALFLTLVFGVFGFAHSAAANDVSSATINVYKAMLYANSDCSGRPETIVDNGATPQSFDFVSAPTIGVGTVPDGTYNCFAMKVQDSVSFIPSTTVGVNCIAGTTYTIDVCQSGIYYYDPDSGFAPSHTGGYSQCTSGTDSVWVFISTASTATTGLSGANAFAPPSVSGACQNALDPSPSCGFNLSSPVTVSGATTGTFIFGTANTLSSGATSCDMQPPNFGFQ